ncbi:uncharacterized protein LOC129289970 [Prosopis cineraria]|uniref:uncharacterized protein LOC129289970 n=1 Tax=Prosopis cineraria TaxID=364024 RepID=UPI00240F6627|nr:uncharacterized protein LOC129289970 [Prosopis cineraria]
MTVGDIKTPTSKKKLKQGWDNPKHFTDLIRYFFIPEDLVYNEEPTSVIKTATKLKRVGITFEPVSDRCLLGAKFLKLPILHWLGFLVFGLKWFKACLQIPKLKVDGSTESVLRNLMGFEQCHYPKHHYVCSYVALIGDLVHTEKDVDVLVERKVIVHEQGSDKDLAGMIYVLCKNIVSNATYYATLSRRLNEHYYSHFNRTLTNLG